MAQTVRIDVTRPGDAEGILVEMAARGFEGELEPSDAGVSMRLASNVSGERDMERALWLALEDTIAQRQLPLVPMASDDSSILLRPAFV
jgi:hypothetical protein